MPRTRAGAERETEQVGMDWRGYDASGIEQLGRAGHPDIVPAEAAWRRRWVESLSLQAVVYGLPAALQYAQMCVDALAPEPPQA